MKKLFLIIILMINAGIIYSQSNNVSVGFLPIYEITVQDSMFVVNDIVSQIIDTTIYYQECIVQNDTINGIIEKKRIITLIPKL